MPAGHPGTDGGRGSRSLPGMRCPRCHDEYEPGVARCVHCHVPLVPSSEPLPPRVDARLGRFHPVVAERIVADLDRRGVGHRTATDDDGVVVTVDRAHRDDLRAELVVNWNGLVGRLPPDDRLDVLAAGGAQPGWYDAPRGAWVDRQGRLQVEPGEDEVELEDARRTVGPMLLTLGVVLALFGWYGGGSSREVVILVGMAMVVAGVFTPR